MKKNFITKSLLYFNPKLVFELKKEDITDDIINIIKNKNIDLNLDTNNLLKSNHHYLSERIEYDSDVYKYFDKQYLSDSEYYNLFAKYFEKWRDNYKILEQYSDVLENIDLEKTFGSDFCKRELVNYFDSYEKIPKFIKKNNIELFNTFFVTDECFKLYSEFIKNVKKELVDEKFKEKFFQDIGLGLQNHSYIKDFIVEYLIVDKESKDKLYNFILENSGNLNIDEYDYFLDDEFYRNYYEIHPEKFDISKYKFNNNIILERSNLVEYLLNLENVSLDILQKFESCCVGELQQRIRDKKISKVVDNVIDMLSSNNNLINTIVIEHYSEEQLIRVAKIMKDFKLPHNIKNLWKNEYYVEILINEHKIDEFICLDYFDNYSIDLKIKLFNYYKDKDVNPVREKLTTNNYDFNTYSLIGNSVVEFKYEEINKDDFFAFLRKMKAHNVQNFVKIFFPIDKFDYSFLLECDKLLPNQITNLFNDIDLHYKEGLEEKILYQLGLIKNSKFNKNVVLWFKGEHEDVLSRDLLEKIRLIFPNIKINRKTIEEVIEIDKTLDYYVKSVMDYYGRDNNLKSLSPYEKYIAIYTIVTNYSRYREVLPGEYGGRDRSIYELINSDDQRIVCAGYVTLLNVLLKRAGFECVENNHDPEHVRSIVRIDDDKYGIHTHFICDPTWDSRYDDFANFRGTYNYVHLHFDEINSKDGLTNHGDYKTANNGSIRFNKLEMEESLNEEKLVVALANIERFVDKNQQMLNGIKVGEDISVDEYNEIAQKYSLRLKFEERFLEISICEIATLNDRELEKNLCRLLSNKKLSEYGIDLSIDFVDGTIVFYSHEFGDNNPYFKYLNNYLNCFNFFNEIKVDNKLSIKEIEPLIDKYVDLVVQGIPNEYCGRYKEAGTLDIPFGDQNLGAQVNELLYINDWKNFPYNQFVEYMKFYYTDDKIKMDLVNYLFNFDQNVDFDLFTEWVEEINSDWRNTVSLNDLKGLATKYVKEYEQIDNMGR